MSKTQNIIETHGLNEVDGGYALLCDGGDLLVWASEEDYDADQANELAVARYTLTGVEVAELLDAGLVSVEQN